MSQDIRPHVWTHYIGGSKGRQGSTPTGVKLPSFSWSFWQKNWKIIAVLGVRAPPRKNPGFATALIIVIHFTHQKMTKFMWMWAKNIFKQVCIPVGWVPPTCCPYLPACTAQGVSIPGGCLLLGGGICMGGGNPALHRGRIPPPWTEWQTCVKT